MTNNSEKLIKYNPPIGTETDPLNGNVALTTLSTSGNVTNS